MTCIDCHTGVAHKAPEEPAAPQTRTREDMMGRVWPLLSRDLAALPPGSVRFARKRPQSSAMPASEAQVLQALPRQSRGELPRGASTGRRATWRRPRLPKLPRRNVDAHVACSRREGARAAYSGFDEQGSCPRERQSAGLPELPTRATGTLRSADSGERTGRAGRFLQRLPQPARQTRPRLHDRAQEAEPDRATLREDRGASSNTTCISCHRQVRSQLTKPSHHPIIEGKVTCSNCQ